MSSRHVLVVSGEIVVVPSSKGIGWLLAQVDIELLDNTCQNIGALELYLPQKFRVFHHFEQMRSKLNAHSDWQFRRVMYLNEAAGFGGQVHQIKFIVFHHNLGMIVLYADLQTLDLISCGPANF